MSRPPKVAVPRGGGRPRLGRWPLLATLLALTLLSGCSAAEKVMDRHHGDNGGDGKVRHP